MRLPRALVLLLLIGLADLVATAVLSGQGRIVERNPLMAPVLEGSVGGFVAIKLATLAAGLLLARQDREAVHRACLWGSAAYAGLLSAAFFAP